MLSKIFPIPLQPGRQAEAEALVRRFAAEGPLQEDGTLSFRVYRDLARPDYLLFVEHSPIRQPTTLTRARRPTRTWSRVSSQN